MAESRTGPKFGVLDTQLSTAISAPALLRAPQLCLNHSQEPYEWVDADLGVLWIESEQILHLKVCPNFGPVQGSAIYLIWYHQLTQGYFFTCICLNLDCSLLTGLPSFERWQQDVRHAVLQRIGVAHSGYRDATIPVEESISHVCADLRRRRYLQQPHVAVDYMTSVTGESLHPDLVNSDILAKKNYERFKARMLGEKTRSDYIEPSDKSVEKLSKAEMVGALVAKITSTTHGVEESIG